MFHLRPNVHFQDGSPFTAEDVFTFHRAPDVPRNPASFAPFLKPIADISAPGPLTLVIHTHGPAPLLLTFLSEVGILSHSVGATAATEDYNSGKAVVGTGPYRFQTWQHGDRIVLTRNDAYWGGHPVWDRVIHRYIPNPASRVAALPTGDVDLIDSVAVDDVRVVQNNPAFRLHSTVSSDTVAFVPDVADRKPPFATDASDAPLTQNPLADLRVRQAIDLAINRAGIKRQIMNDQAEIAGQIMAPGEFGYDPGIPQATYDPGKAKALLAAAGYPNGFRLSMHCQGDRFANGPAICQAVAQMLTRIGIRTEPVVLPHAVFIGHANRHEYSLFTAFILDEFGEPSMPLASTFATRGGPRGWGVFNLGQ